MERVVCILIGYLCGCVLTANIVARRKAGKSAFEIGSGNPGMANIGSQFGAGSGAVVLLLDIAKTIVAVVIAGVWCRAFFAGSAFTTVVVASPAHLAFPDSGTLATFYAGLGATIGHNFPFWHRFSGGKGVTTTCSAIILFHPVAGVIACLIGLGIVLVTSQLCYGAVVIPVAFIVALVIMHAPGEVLAIAIVLLVLMLIAHGGPCIRALQGREPETRLLR